jgi:SAM-dependent methyltransferase
MSDTAIAPGNTVSEVIGYYTAKTASIMDRYGPGPRFHFHLGLLPGSPPTLGNADDIRDVIVAGKGDYLKLCEQVWDASKILNGRLIDIGCGLGGPSIFWAQRHRVHFTAVTIVIEHARVVREFAERAGVGDRLEPLVADFTALRGAGTFDVATSNEAICYMDRDLVFARASELLPVGGCLHRGHLPRPTRGQAALRRLLGDQHRPDHRIRRSGRDSRIRHGPQRGRHQPNHGPLVLEHRLGTGAPHRTGDDRQANGRHRAAAAALDPRARTARVLLPQRRLQDAHHPLSQSPLTQFPGHR